MDDKKSGQGSSSGFRVVALPIPEPDTFHRAAGLILCNSDYLYEGEEAPKSESEWNDLREANRLFAKMLASVGDAMDRGVPMDRIMQNLEEAYREACENSCDEEVLAVEGRRLMSLAKSKDDQPVCAVAELLLMISRKIQQDKQGGATREDDTMGAMGDELKRTIEQVCKVYLSGSRVAAISVISDDGILSVEPGSGFAGQEQATALSEMSSPLFASMTKATAASMAASGMGATPQQLLQQLLGGVGMSPAKLDEIMREAINSPEGMDIAERIAKLIKGVIGKIGKDAPNVPDSAN